MMSSTCRRGALVVAVVTLFAGPALGQDDDPAKLLEEFIHYTLIAKPDLASGYAEKLFRSGLSDADLAETIDDSRELAGRFEDAIIRAHLISELEDIAAELERRLNEGRLDLARDGDRITKAIAMLTGNQRMKIQSRRLLAEAGEFAVPYLLRQIVEGGDERLRSASGDMLVEVGRQTVTPLCVALPHLDDRNQRFVCGVLGEIGLPHAAPYLMELSMADATAAATRDAAARAFRQVGGLGGDLSRQFDRLGQQYFNEAESLVASAFEPTNNVWTYDPLFGLEATPIPTEIYSEVMAMRTASRALRIDPRNRRALSLFVAANLKRANELPAGAADPIFGENRYSPDFYATVFGTEICMDVLAMGIDRLDTSLVRDAIAALSQTTGGANLFTMSDGRQPLLEALRYPDRRVQYEAALTLGRALPGQRFSGDVSVVPLLASAVRTGETAYAVVISQNGENRRVASTRLDELGFTILAAGQSFETVRSEM
ncbi:MAG: hypothetical protein V3T28_09490, partial [Gemmatimonadales bacterium]